MDHTTLPKAQEREKKKALSADREKLLLDKLKADSGYFPIFRTGSLSGMRIGEILEL